MKPLLAFLLMTACCTSAQTADTAQQTVQALMSAHKYAEAEQMYEALMGAMPAGGKENG